MSAGDLKRYLLRDLETQRDSVIERIARGNAPDYAQYQHLVGRAAAFEDAMRVVAETFKHYEESDDDE